MIFVNAVNYMSRYLLILLLLFCNCAIEIASRIEENIIPKKLDPIPFYEPEFEELFSVDKVKTIHIHISEDEWNGLLNDYDRSFDNKSEICRKADFYFGEDTATAQIVRNVGFRLRGNTTWSRRRPEKGEHNNGLHHKKNTLIRTHFKIKFNETFSDDESVYGGVSSSIPEIKENKSREFMTVRQLNLKTNLGHPTYVPEVFAHDLMYRFGVETQRACFTKLFIKIGDDPSQYFGVYSMIEHVDSRWVERRFNESNALIVKGVRDSKTGHNGRNADLSIEDHDGNLFSGSIGVEVIDPSDPNWEFTKKQYRPLYDIKSSKKHQEVTTHKLNTLIELLNSNPSVEKLDQEIDITSFIKGSTVNVLLGNYDNYWRSGTNYYLIYLQRKQQWMYVPFDFDRTFHRFIKFSMYDWHVGGFNSKPQLITALWAHKEYRDLYTWYMEELTSSENIYTNDSDVAKRMVDMQSIILSHTADLDAQESNNHEFSPDLSQIKKYLKTRVEQVREQIDRYHKDNNEQ